MFPSQSCRLCVNICHDHHSLYDEDGRKGEVYALTEKYFIPLSLDLECDRQLAVICTVCWSHIFEFHTFQEYVLLAQGRLNARAVPEKDDPLEKAEFNTTIPPDSIETDVQLHNAVRCGSEVLTNINYSSHSQGFGSAFSSEGYTSQQSEVIVKSQQEISIYEEAITTYTVKPTALNLWRHNEVHSEEFHNQIPEDLINSIPSNISQDRDNVGKDEVPLDTSPFNSNPTNAIASGVECSNVELSGQIETLSPEGLINDITSNISPDPGNAGPTIEQYEAIVKSEVGGLISKANTNLSSGSAVLTNYTASTLFQVQGNVSSEEEQESQESGDPDEQWEEFDDPVGVFAGGEFDNRTEKTSESESESLSESEWSSGSFSSDDDLPLAVQTRQRKLKQPKEQDSKSTLLAKELQGKATSKSETTNSEDNVHGRHSYEKNFKRPKAGPEFDVTSESEGLLAQCRLATRSAKNANTKRDQPGDVTTNKENLENFEKQKPKPAKGNPSETNKRIPKTALEFDVSASESESDEDFSSDVDMSETESTIQTSSAAVPAKSKYIRPNKQFSYKKYMKRLQTVQDFDDYIAHWRPNLECVICRETCPSFSLLRQHFEKQHPKEECHIVCCQVKFYHRYKIEKHIHFHNEPKAHKCKVCYRCFTTSNSLRQHLQKHTGIQVDAFKCPKCAKCYVHEHSLKIHMKYSCNTGKNSTSTAGSGGHTLTSLGFHKRKVHLGCGHKCSICDKLYPSPALLDQHVTYAHLGQHTSTCLFCPKTCSSSGQVYTHMNRMHRKQWEEKKKEKKKNKVKKVYKCTACDNVYKNSQGLHEHRAIHAGKTLYTCSLCPKTYKYSSNVAAHFKRVHFKEWQKKNNCS